MRFKSGKHEGKTYEEVLLKDPALAQFLAAKGAASVAEELQRLIRVFDRKPITASCVDCGNTATRATGYSGSPTLFFWCESCNPRHGGADPAKLYFVRTFNDAMIHVDRTLNGNKAAKTKIVRQLAQAKGLPNRVSEDAAIAFFA